MPPLPISMIVDDPAPIINPLYYFRLQVDKVAEPRQESGERMPASIPLDLLERFAAATGTHGVRGKFSLLPYPAGLGSIVDGWEGADRRELQAWLKLARERVAPRFDITPEVLTHTLALDLQTRRLLPIAEHLWSQTQDEAALTPYLTAALAILRDAGFDANGMTSPCDFGTKSEPAYAHALLRAQQAVYGRNQTWYFLHIDTDPQGRQSSVSYRDAAGGRVVSIVSKCGDFAWQSMEDASTGDSFVNTIADQYLTADGTGGRLTALRAAGVPILFHTHWQSLYANGRFTGMRAMERVFERVARCFGNSVRWTTCSALADAVAATANGPSTARVD